MRGLEGRVRGLDGLPPERELALIEVEKLRREWEGWARRRAGVCPLLEETPRMGGGKAARGNGKGSGKC